MPQVSESPEPSTDEHAAAHDSSSVLLDIPDSMPMVSVPSPSRADLSFLLHDDVGCVDISKISFGTLLDETAPSLRLVRVMHSH